MRKITLTLALSLLLSPLAIAATPEQDRDAGAAAIKGLYDYGLKADERATTATTRAADLAKQLDAANAEIARLKTPAPPAYDVKAGESIVAKAKAAQRGSTLRVQPGPRPGEVLTGFSGVNLDLTGVTFDGRGAPAPALRTHDATIVGGEWFNWVGANNRDKAVLQASGNNLTLKGIKVHDVAGAGFGSNVREHIVLDGVDFRDLTGSAYLMGGGDRTPNVRGLVIRNSRFERWNTAGAPVGTGEGVNKITRTAGFLSDGNTFKGGRGSGTYFDINNVDPVVRNSVYDGLEVAASWYDPIAIFIEISPAGKGLVENNVFLNFHEVPNPKGGLPLKGPCAIMVAESTGVTVRGNRVYGGFGIAIRNVRDRAYHYYDGATKVTVPMSIGDVLIEGNELYDRANAMHRSSGDWGTNPAEFLRSRNVVERNNVRK